MSAEPLWIRMGPAEFWRAAWEAAVSENPRWRDAAGDETFWSGFAPDYDRRSPLAACATEIIRDLRALLPAGGTLLDIGAGTGAFTRRLAPGLSAITCVEPSAAMRRSFAASYDGAAPVTTLDCDWLGAPEGLGADLVLCANALYRTGDIAGALEKMTRAARRHVAIVQTVGRLHAGPLVLREGARVWERERADAICDILEALSQAHERRDYLVPRPDGDCRVALLIWSVS